MGHVGATRLLQSLCSFFFAPNLKAAVEKHVYSCESCQRNKNQGRGYGHLPPRQDISIPWEEVAVDLIGPWQIIVEGVGQLRVQALTAIDTCTTLAELVRIENKTSAHVAFKFEQSWLSRYPRPLRCVHDPGREFTGSAFQLTLHQLAIQSVATTVKNPQANAICERMHKTCGDMIRTLMREQPPSTMASAFDMIDAVLAASQQSLRTVVHRTLGILSGSLVFGRDMLVPIPVLTDMEVIRNRRQAVIDDNTRRVNLRRIYKDYKIGDQVLLKVYNPATLDERAEGPFSISQVHVNGTVTIKRAKQVFERINIRRIRPFTPS